LFGRWIDPLVYLPTSMKTIWDTNTYQEVVRRFESLQPNTPRQWGKMSVAQMLEHNARVLEVVTGKAPMKQAFVGKLISWMFKKRFLGEEPFGKNGPTGPELIVGGEPDFAKTKDKVRALLAELNRIGAKGCDGRIHGFFGRLTGEEWGVCQYKHLDHHLRQFGV
jgi:uncharacterized protein DUF1569